MRCHWDLAPSENGGGAIHPKLKPEAHDHQNGEANVFAIFDELGHGRDIVIAWVRRKRRMRVPFAKVVEAREIVTSTPEEIIERLAVNLRIAAER